MLVLADPSQNKGMAITLWETQAGVQISESGYSQERLVTAIRIYMVNDLKVRHRGSQSSSFVRTLRSFTSTTRPTGTPHSARSTKPPRLPGPCGRCPTMHAVTSACSCLATQPVKGHLCKRWHGTVPPTSRCGGNHHRSLSHQRTSERGALVLFFFNLFKR
jgi:hypothetical protein